MRREEDPDKWVFVRVCVCLCTRLCVRGRECTWSRETTDDVNLVYGKGEWCDMCSSEIARVRAGGGEQTIWKRHRVCVWERGVRARGRES